MYMCFTANDVYSIQIIYNTIYLVM